MLKNYEYILSIKSTTAAVCLNLTPFYAAIGCFVFSPFGHMRTEQSVHDVSECEVFEVISSQRCSAEFEPGSGCDQ